MNMPPPVACKSYNSHVECRFEATKRKCQESMHRARQLVKKLELESGQDLEDGIINTAVSYDGTWHKRGFSSLYGATFVITEQTSQVLDYDVMSKTCSTCRLWAYEDQQSSEYKEFWQFHKDQCHIRQTTQDRHLAWMPKEESHSGVGRYNMGFDISPSSVMVITRHLTV